MSEELAKEREEYAKTLSQEDIWNAVITNAIKMEAPAEMRAEILLSAITDIGIIYRLLKDHHRKGELNAEDYQNLLNILIEKIEERKKDVDFNPIMMKDKDGNI